MTPSEWPTVDSNEVDLTLPPVPRWDPLLGDNAAAPARVIRVREFGEVEVDTTDLIVDGRISVFDRVRDHGYFDIRLASRGRLRITAGGAIGLIPLNRKITLDVRPRVPIANVAHVLSVAEGEVVPLELLIRGYDETDEVAPSILDALARSLLDSLRELERSGLYREYLRRELGTTFPRGRILTGTTMTQHVAAGEDHRVRVAYFDQSTDNGPNQLIKYALHWLVPRYRRLGRTVARRMMVEINRFDHLLAGTTIDHSRRFMAHPAVVDPSRIPVLRAYYDAPVRLAKAIIRHRGIEIDGRDDLLLDSLVINLELTFENYVRVVLARQLADLGPRVQILDGNMAPGSGTLFDQHPNQAVTPDIVVRQEPGRHPLVVEVKYIDRSPGRPEINQALAYGQSYRAENVMLVHPRPEGGLSRNYRVNTIGPMAVHFFAVDLGGDLRDEEEALAAYVRAIVTA